MFNVLNVNERLYDAFMKERKGKKRSVHAVSKICGTDKRALQYTKHDVKICALKTRSLQSVPDPKYDHYATITPHLLLPDKTAVSSWLCFKDG